MTEQTNLVPKRRFKEFQNTHAWEERKLGDMGKTFTGLSGKTKEDFGHGSAEYVTYMNVFSNPISDTSMTENVEVDSKQNELEYGDVLFTTSSETPQEVGMSSVWLGNRPNVYLNSFCFGYRPTVNVNYLFLAYLLRSNTVRKQMMLLAQGISRYNISKSKVMELRVGLPDIQEQEKIRNFFKQLDHNIALHQHKLEKTKALKSAYLYEMFPAEGEREPKRRFVEFADEWEQHKLGDLMEISSASRVHKDEWTESGVPFFRSSDVVSKFKGTESNKAFISQSLFEKLSKKSGRVKKGDVLVTGGGSIGIPYLVKNDNPLYFKDADLIWLKSSEKINGTFLYTFFTTSLFRNYVNSITHIGTISHYTIEQAKVTPIRIPTKEEQTKIGNFFTQLDDTIALHQSKLEKLQNIKKAYLNEMFV